MGIRILFIIVLHSALHHLIHSLRLHLLIIGIFDVADSYGLRGIDTYL